MRSKLADRLLLVATAALIFGALVAFALHRSRSPERVQWLVDVNPSWEVGRSSSTRLEVAERASGARLLIAESEAGPYAMTRVPCAEMTKAAPPWFRVPPDVSAAPPLPCVRLRAEGHDVWITNFRTTLDVPEIWDDYYAPLIRDYPYASSGGRSTVAADDARRFANVVDYSITPHDQSDRRETRFSAFYVDGRATVVVAFRDVAP